MKFKGLYMALGAMLLIAVASTGALAQQMRVPTTTKRVAYEYYQPEAAPSPNDAPMPPGAGADAAPEIPRADNAEESAEGDDMAEGEEEESEEEPAEEEEEEEPEPVRLIPAHGNFAIYGWIDQGYSKNGYDNVRDPAAGFGNLPQTFNYRDNEYQLNQLYLVAEKTLDTECHCWDIGGRVDLLYGEDYIFTQAVGLETRPNGINRWNKFEGGNGIFGTSRNGLAMPQVYGEVGVHNLSVKVGHFYTIMGYEVVTAPDNFFYSHAYTMQYGEPFTHTGALATWTHSDYLTVWGGVVNGWDKFDAVEDRAAFLGGVKFTNCDGSSSLAFTVITGDEDGTLGVIQGNRTLYSVVYTRAIGCNLEYVFQHDHGWQENANFTGQDAEWYGVNQYLFYTINDCWRAGVRGEWFCDDDGYRVTLRPGAPEGANWYSVATGLNYTPNLNVTVRPEVRWDWYDAHADNTAGVFKNGTRDTQVVFGIDAIIQF